MNSNRLGTFVSSSEIERYTLHQTLRGLMPEEVAATLMSHLPPAGWSDVALRPEVNDKFDQVYERFDLIDKRFEQIDRRFDQIDKRFEQIDERFDRVEARVDRIEVKIDKLASMKRYVVTTGIALAALITGFGVPAIILGVQILAALN
jgi:hypothetical protein